MEVVKVIGSIVALFTILKIFFDISIARSSRRRENYKLVKEFITDLEDENTDQFLIQNGFFALTGKLLNVSEIKYLMSHDNPYSVIDLKPVSERFVLFNEATTNYSWRRFYKTKFMKKYGVIFFNVLYAILISVATLPHVGGERMYTLNFEWALYSIVLVIVAIISLNFADNLKQSRKFMEMVDG